MKQLAERIAQIIRMVISSTLLKLLPQAHITLTEIEVSDDLRYATIWVSSFSEEQSLGSLLKQIEGKKTELQKALASNLETKFTPLLSFRPDTGKSHAKKVDKLLDEISQ